MRNAWLLGSGCLWAAMMYLLFDAEIRPYFEYQRPPSYRTMLRDRTQPEVQRRSIIFSRNRIGEAETLVVPLAGGGYSMTTRMTMKMSPFGALPFGDDRIFMANEVRVDPAFQLSEFAMTGRMTGIPLSIKGQRRKDKLQVEYDLQFVKGKTEFDFPMDATLSDDFLPFQGGARLSEGKKWKMKMLDAENFISINKTNKLALTELYVNVTEKEKIQAMGKEIQAWKVEVRKDLSKEVPAYTVWVDDSGTVVRQVKMINKIPVEILLEERRTLSPREAEGYAWTVK